MKTLWILENQLHVGLAGFRELDREHDVVLLIETADRSLWKREHKQKLVLTFAAMRHFAAELRQQGYGVDYLEVEDLAHGLREHQDHHQSSEILIHETTDQRLSAFLTERLFEQLQVPIRWLSDEPLFYVSRQQWPTFLADGKTWRQDEVYRKLRRRYHVLMDDDGPTGGKWSFDKENRKPPPEGLNFPEPLQFPPDAITREVMAKVERQFPHAFGSLETFAWPVTRGQALEALEQFIQERLPTFGDYQDAMLEADPWMSHSLLSAAMNLGLITPDETVRAAEAAYHQGRAPLPAVEGFIRQILGWREYIRGVYLRSMPKYETVNALDHENPLPGYYWTGETELHCVAVAVKDVMRHGYSHHIQRLMVLGNWANLLRVRPQEVSDWFLEAYVDAHDWVVLPNVLGMALFADGGRMSTKPYIASGQYIHRMSDYCRSCAFSVHQKTGATACPFHALYWTFLEDHRPQLQSNPRMRLMYANWDRQDPGQRDALIARGRQLLQEHTGA